jgi:hypothetical protein
MRSIMCRVALAAAVLPLLTVAANGAKVPRVRNDAEPRLGSRTVELEPLWTVGGTEDGELLGTIERVLALDDGRVILMDSQLSQVLECGADGRVIRRIGGPGSGPGELTKPRDMVRFDDGTIGLVKVFPGELVLLTADGLPAGVVAPTADDAPGGFVTLHRALLSGGTLLLGGSIMTMNPDTPVQTRTFFLGSFDRGGRKTAEYARAVAEFDMREGKLHESWQEFVWSRMGVGADGTVVVCIPRDAFELSWFAPGGELVRMATLPADSWQRNDLARERMHGILAEQADHMPGTVPVVTATEPVVADLSVRSGGDVWCLTSRSMWEAEDGAFAAYDVFDTAGNYTRRVRVVCAGDATRDRLLFSGDLVYRVAGYWDAVHRVRGSASDPDAEPMSVTCYRIR